MSIERWDPFREAVSLRDAMNHLFQESFVRPGQGDERGAGVSPLALDVHETDDEYVVKANLPGHEARGRADHRPRRHPHDPRRDQAEEDKKDGTWHLREPPRGVPDGPSPRLAVDPDKAKPASSTAY